MLRPGSAIKRTKKVLPAAIQQKQQESAKLPDATHFLKKRDFIAAQALFECDRKYSARSDAKTYLGIAYSAFHNGDYKRAMDCYDDLMKRQGYDQNLHVYKGCCLYALCQFKEAKEESKKCGEDSALKMRLLFQLAQKLGEESEIMTLHGKLTSSIEDQLCMAALHYLRSHFEEATEIYKKLLMENRDLHAVNIYVALCYYKMDYYDVSLEILAVYLGLHADSIVGVNLRACNHYQLYNGKAAEAELKALANASTVGNVL
jgi:intraflagellar transport protein 56